MFLPRGDLGLGLLAGLFGQRQFTFAVVSAPPRVPRRIHPHHPHIATQPNQLHPEFGFTELLGPKRRSESQHVLRRQHPEFLGRHQMPQLVQRNRKCQTHNQGNDSSQITHTVLVVIRLQSK